MKILKKDAIFFIIGGLGYATLELLLRGFTHWSMIIAGGICFVMFSKIAKRYSGRSRTYKAVLCAVCVTSVELIFGIIFNMILKMNVWDYSNVPLNFLGQICLLYTLLWGLLGFLFIPLAELLNKKLEV